MINKIKTWAIGLSLIVVSLLICLLLAEVSIRIYLYLTEKNPSSIINSSRDTLSEKLKSSSSDEPDTHLGSTSLRGLIQPSPFKDVVYQLRPNLNVIFQAKNVKTNSAGFRGKEYLKIKDPGTFRIVGIGDSVMFGWGVNLEDTYLNKLENKLNSKNDGRKYEVLNFGVPGYNTAMEVSYFENLASRYNPDLVVIHFVNNDFTVPMFMEQSPDYGSLKESFFFEFVKNRISQSDLSITKRLNREIKNLTPKEKKRVMEQYKHMIGHDGYRTAMKRLAELTLMKDIPVVILIGSSRRQDKEMIKKKVAKKYGFEVVEITDTINEYVKQKKLPQSKSERRKLIQVSDADSHPNSLGHDLYEAALMPKIEEIISRAR